MNGQTGQMSKCDFCIDLLTQGQNPICVDTCPLNAIKFGTIKELRERYGHLNQVQGLPDCSITRPNLVVKPHSGAIVKGDN